jgi:hypothetical protein
MTATTPWPRCGYRLRGVAPSYCDRPVGHDGPHESAQPAPAPLGVDPVSVAHRIGGAYQLGHDIGFQRGQFRCLVTVAWSLVLGWVLVTLLADLLR